MKRTTGKGALGMATGLAAAAALVASSGLSSRAYACGGFFCSAQAPVTQQAEEIVFVDNGDETTTMIVRIQYFGPSEQFAWVVPVPGVPDIELSSNQAFDNLRSATDPQYTRDVEVEGECMDGDQDGFGGFGVTTDTAAPQAGSVDEDGAVDVLDSGTVGPYDYDVIRVDPTLEDAADVAVEWLGDNGYDVTAVGPDVLRPYLEENLNLLAFRLTKGAMAGAIRPVMLTLSGDKPSIPIRPTAVAAAVDMGVRVWLVSDKQAIPKNYKSLVINEALINWFNYRQNYDQVITAAADQAGGQGFVTELAGNSSRLENVVFATWMEQQWMEYSLSPFADGYDAIEQASWRYRGWDGFREAICDTVTLPQGVTCDEFGRNPDQFRNMVSVDANTFVEEVFTKVVKPVIDTQRLLTSRPYVTRMYSTMSADEMTLDPVFDWNNDLADVSNVHVAKQFIECSSRVFSWDAPWRIELPQGGVIRGEGGYGWPIELDSLPANLRIVQLSTQGSGDVMEDNVEMVLDALFEQSGEMASGAATPDVPDRGTPIGGMMPDVGGDDDGAAGGSDGDGLDGAAGNGIDATDGIDGTPDDGELGGGDDAKGSGGGGGGGLCAVSTAGDGSGPSAGLIALLLAPVVLRVRRRFARGA